MEHQSLYQILGVPLDVEPAQLKRAYRDLAKQHHPDLNPGVQAEERFKEIAFAYRILSNPSTRDLYDKYGPLSLRDDFDPARVDPLDQAIYEASRRRAQKQEREQAQRPHPAPSSSRPRRTQAQARPTGPRGQDIHQSLSLPISQIPQGAQVTLQFTRRVTCHHCKGTASEPGSGPRLCGACSGLGRIGLGPSSKACQACQGQGRRQDHPCRQCRGDGQLAQPASLQLRVPPGAYDGARITVRGRGHAARGPGEPGDLLVELRLLNDTPFERRGHDLHTTLTVYLWEAALGLPVTAPTLTGDITLHLPEGSTGGDEIIHPHAGLPRPQELPGAMVYHLRIHIPRPQTAEERALYQQLAALHP